MLEKFKVKTFGCQMNVYDSQKISDIFYKLGYKNTFIDEEADIYLINTCHIRDKAKQKLYSELGKIYKIKKNRFQNSQNTITIVAGCVAQAEGAEIFRRAPFVDIVVGSQAYQKLPNLIKKVKKKNKEKNKQFIELDFDPKSKFDDLPKKQTISQVSSYLTIQEGCDKFCKFCVVPYTRGPEYSRTVEEIVREAEFLIKNGTKEIILLGQNVNAYHGIGFGSKEFNLGKLIYVLEKIKGLKRIRYMTAHPKDMHKDLYNAHGDLEKLMPFLHLPIQSGSNKILKAMNRNYTVEEYLKIINKVKKIRKDIVFSSDFIVGYPGESKEDFQKTLDLVDKIKYVQSFSFIYSPRPGTTAYNLKNNIEENEKKERLNILQSKLKFYQEKFNKNFVKKPLEVLFNNSLNKKNQSVGYSQYMQLVRINNKRNVQGRIKNIKIKKSFYKSLEAISIR
jgi:tRNA-2-methylthio-N6-dimethylallyladenosine synthase